LLLDSIPPEYASDGAKFSLKQTRRNSMARVLQTGINMKAETDWTLAKVKS
jgi:hypothetical protein